MRVLSARYGPRNQKEANDLRWNDRVQEAKEVECSVQRDVEQGISELARQNQISQSMVIGQFLNPSKEEVDDESDEIVEGIAKACSTGDRTHETDEEDVVIPRVSHAEALQALQKLRLFEEQHEDRDSELIARINQHERVMRAPESCVCVGIRGGSGCYFWLWWWWWWWWCR